MSFYSSQSANRCYEREGERVSLGANLRYEKPFWSRLADDTSTFLLEGVLILGNAFDQDVLLHSSLNVLLDLLAAFRSLE